MANKFVFLRIQKMNGVDLNLFKYDYDLTWMAFCINADGKVYCRYGGCDPDSAETRATKESRVHAMNEGLRLHAEELAKKAPPPPAVPPKRIDDYTMFKNVLKTNPNICVHCHLV